MQNRSRMIILELAKRGELNLMDKREAQYLAFVLTTSEFCYNMVEKIKDKDALLELYEFVEFIEHSMMEDFGYEHKMS